MGSDDPEIVTRAAYGRSLALAAVGRCDDAVATARKGLQIATTEGQIVPPPEAQFLGAVFGHAAAGRLDLAEGDARTAYDGNVGTGNLEGVGTFALVLGLVLAEKGDCSGAIRMFRECIAISRDLKDVLLLRLSLGGLALASGMSGHAAESAAAVSELDRVGSHWMILHEPDFVDRGVAWCRVASGEISAAQISLRTSADRVAGRGLWIAEAKLRHDLVRLGEARHEVERLRELAQMVQGDLVPAFARHAEAVVNPTGERLEAAAEAFQSMGALLLGAEAYHEAAAAYRSEGLRRRSGAADRASEELRSESGAIVTPVLQGGSGVAFLTPREKEVAVLASSGLSSREIAQRLYISVRTVDNQLQRVYAKLGVTSRDALADALGGP
jgi:DNA-binding CsgD family transcriptional regulator